MPLGMLNTEVEKDGHNMNSAEDIQQRSELLKQQGSQLDASRAALEQKGLEVNQAYIQAARTSTSRMVGGGGRSGEVQQWRAKQLKQKAAKFATSKAQAYEQELSSYNSMVESYNKAGESLTGDISTYNIGVEHANQLFKDVYEQKDTIHTVRITSRTNRYKGSNVVSFTGYSDAGGGYSNESVTGSFLEGHADLKSYALSESRRKFGINENDTVYLNGEIIQAPNISGDVLSSARSIQADRNKFWEESKKYRAEKQDFLKQSMLESPTAKWASPSAYSEAFKGSYGRLPTQDIVNSVLTPVSSKQFAEKSRMLRSPTAQWASPEFYAQETEKFSRRGSPLKIKPNKLTWYGVEGSSGYQWSEQANRNRIDEINTASKSSFPGIDSSIPSFMQNYKENRLPQTQVDYPRFGYKSETELKGVVFGLMERGTEIDRTIQGMPIPGFLKGMGRGVGMLGTGLVTTGAAIAVTVPITLERYKKGTLWSSLKATPKATVTHAKESLYSTFDIVAKTPDMSERIGLGATLLGGTFYGGRVAGKILKIPSKIKTTLPTQSTIKVPSGLLPKQAIKFKAGAEVAFKLGEEKPPIMKPLDFTEVKALGGFGKEVEAWVRSSPEQKPVIGGSAAARTQFKYARLPGDIDIDVVNPIKAAQTLYPKAQKYFGPKDVSLDINKEFGQATISIKGQHGVQFIQKPANVLEVDIGQHTKLPFSSKSPIEIGGIKYKAAGELFQRKADSILRTQGNTIGPRPHRMKDIADFKKMSDEWIDVKKTQADKSWLLKGYKLKQAQNIEKNLGVYKMYSGIDIYPVAKSVYKQMRKTPPNYPIYPMGSISSSKYSVQMPKYAGRVSSYKPESIKSSGYSINKYVPMKSSYPIAKTTFKPSAYSYPTTKKTITNYYNPQPYYKSNIKPSTAYYPYTPKQTKRTQNFLPERPHRKQKSLKSFDIFTTRKTKFPKFGKFKEVARTKTVSQMLKGLRIKGMKVKI